MALPQQGTETIRLKKNTFAVYIVLMALPQQGTETLLNNQQLSSYSLSSVNGLTPTGDGNSNKKSKSFFDTLC